LNFVVENSRLIGTTLYSK